MSGKKMKSAKDIFFFCLFLQLTISVIKCFPTVACRNLKQFNEKASVETFTETQNGLPSYEPQTKIIANPKID